MKDSAPLVSVILPLPDDRGKVLQSVASFMNQSLDASRVEVLVASNCDAPDLENEIATRFPSVRWVRRAGSNLPALYNLAASAASGTYLYLSESHCVADPRCLEEAVSGVERQGLDCARSQSDGINENAISSGEQRIFEQDLQEWRRTGNGKLAIRGFLITRAAWKLAGGLRSEFGHFSEVMMGRQLEAIGIRIGYVEESIVHHFNQTDFRDLNGDLLQYGFDECRSCHLAPPGDASLMPTDWTRRERHRRRLGGIRRRLVSARLRVHWYRAVMNVPCLPPEAYFRAFGRRWETLIRIGRLRYLASTEMAFPSHGRWPPENWSDRSPQAPGASEPPEIVPERPGR